MAKKVVKLDNDYSTLNMMAVTIVAPITKLFELHNSLLSNIDTNLEYDSKSFAKLDELLGSFNKLLSKLGSSSQSSSSQESFSKIFCSLESTLKADLAPLLKLVNLMPSNASPVRIGVQGGEKGFYSGSSKGFDTGSSKDPSNGSFFKMPITNGIFIGSYATGSISKPPSSTEENKGKRKGIYTDPTEEEKYITLEKEIERHRNIQSMLRQREADPPGLRKGDPMKPYCYKTIEQFFSLGIMHDFVKVPKKSNEIEK
ncbi:unnamed protein product [Lactuca saligna]|uniref:Uncharacterized protein n=1 Tax=Lactuca saligna TaxID=75948 RepID=A0AA35ZWL2_LACSI|nr:unnamed protein product [Lactuca saligna]